MKPLINAALFCIAVASAQAKTDCTVTEQLPFTKSGAQTLHILAFAVGETCEGAVVGFSVVDDNGHALWTYSKNGDQIAYFLDDGAKQKSIFALLKTGQPALMRKTLREWLTQQLKSTGGLPDWPKSSAKLEPKEGDFGFYVAEDMRRDAYLNYRKRKLPLFCFHSGVESTTCIIADGNGEILEIGGESIP